MGLGLVAMPRVEKKYGALDAVILQAYANEEKESAR